jgi:hypothetical protein
MADADTRDKRFSMIGLAKPWLRAFKNPTGTVDAEARAMLLFLYGGIPLDSPVAFVLRNLPLLGAG